MSKRPHVLAHAKIVEAWSMTTDWLVLVMSFLVFAEVSYVYATLTMGEWDLWIGKDRRLWVTLTPVMYIAFPAAAQYFLWSKMRVPFGATFPTLGLLFGEWANRYFIFWAWTYPINLVWAATLIPGAIILDVILLWSKSYVLTAVVGGLSFGLIFYPGNWPMLAPFHQPVEYHGMVITIADIQGYNYVQTPEYLRLLAKEPLRTFGRDVVSWSAFFSGFVLLTYFIWHFFRLWLERYLGKSPFTSTVYKESGFEKQGRAMYREKLIVLSIFLLSLAISVAGITLLGGTTVGFAMFFSGGILAYEYYLLLSEYK